MSNKTPWLRGQQNGNGSPAQTFDTERLAILKRTTYQCPHKLALLASIKKQLGLPASHSFVA